MDDYDMGNLSRSVLYSEQEAEQIRKKVFKEDKFKEDNPLIIINSVFVRFVLKQYDERIDIFEALIAHEMRHVVEQYILEDTNTMESDKNTLHKDYIMNNVFKDFLYNNVTNGKEVYEYSKDLSYCISEEEQRGRIQATWNLCKKVSKNNFFYAQLTSSYNATKSFSITNNDLKSLLKDNFRSKIIAVLRTYPFKYVHMLPKFTKLVLELRNSVRLYNKTKNCVLIIGYYLMKHNYIRTVDKETLKKMRIFFCEENVKKKLKENVKSEEIEYYVIVQKTVFNIFRRYQNTIFNVVGLNIEEILRIDSGED